ncbi:hypothetical protein AMC99_01346 [Altererythrobacter epoxidivorans]|uniref:Uncharacterized protein n=1 Tax=Altererythrobacter epoxidivorans TaxID=361183 RepID=A0A0M4M4E5_9SPHN|nr:hypothetical protein [Altererythrobacter epoxidivorans]ALE16640.1 hypothetical protein AMC99_01346 [Altererythrobacter epoxidivorans]
MTRNAIVISTWAKGAVAAALMASAVGASARDDEVVRDREPDVEDVAVTPLTDLNISKDEIPEVLLVSAEDPYASGALGDCAAIGAAIADLDRVLGYDYDIQADKRDRISEGRIAQKIVGSFIPFRGILREITGAADHERQFQAAIMAGMVRRGYLKGLGEARDCPYPSRPAFTQVAVNGEQVQKLVEREKAAESQSSPPPIAYSSIPVVQGEN